MASKRVQLSYSLVSPILRGLVSLGLSTYAGVATPVFTRQSQIGKKSVARQPLRGYSFASFGPMVNGAPRSRVVAPALTVCNTATFFIKPPGITEKKEVAKIEESCVLLCSPESCQRVTTRTLMTGQKRSMTKQLLILMLLCGGQWAFGQSQNPCVDYGTDAEDGANTSSTSLDPCPTSGHPKQYIGNSKVRASLETKSNDDFIARASFAQLSATPSLGEMSVAFASIFANDGETKLKFNQLKLRLVEFKQLISFLVQQDIRIAVNREVSRPKPQSTVEGRIKPTSYSFNTGTNLRRSHIPTKMVVTPSKRRSI